MKYGEAEALGLLMPITVMNKGIHDEEMRNSESLMSAATASNAKPFTIRDMTETNNAKHAGNNDTLAKPATGCMVQRW